MYASDLLSGNAEVLITMTGAWSPTDDGGDQAARLRQGLSS
jgi:hypothetical protein